MQNICILIDFPVSTRRKIIDILVLCLAEMFGTAILLFMGCLGTAAEVYPIPTFVFGPFNFGLTIAYIIQVCTQTMPQNNCLNFNSNIKLNVLTF